MSATRRELNVLRGEIGALAASLTGNGPSASGYEVLAPTPHPGQALFLASDAARRVLVAHRRWGKEWACCVDVLRRVRQWRKEPHRKALVPAVSAGAIYPTHDLASEFWRVLCRMVPASEVVRCLESAPRRLELRGDVAIEVRSGSDPGKLVAGGYDLLLLGEAGELAGEVWQNAQPFLANPGRANMAIFQGTPRGQNWFRGIWERAADEAEGDWWGLRIPYFDEATGEVHALANPHISRAVVEQERREMTERWFAQEWLASFLTSEGAVFRDPRARIAAAPDCPQAPLVAGLDLARRRDFTVLSIFDAAGRQVDLLRIRELAYQTQAARIVATLGGHGVKRCVVEVNSIGDPFCEMLREALAEQQVRCELVEFTTTAPSKRQAIEGLVVAFEQAKITLLPDEVQANEFEAFSASQSKGGNETFAAAQGHDDCVMAAALAWTEIAATYRRPDLPDARQLRALEHGLALPPMAERFDAEGGLRYGPRLSLRDSEW